MASQATTSTSKLVTSLTRDLVDDRLYLLICGCYMCQKTWKRSVQPGHTFQTVEELAKGSWNTHHISDICKIC